MLPMNVFSKSLFIVTDSYQALSAMIDVAAVLTPKEMNTYTSSKIGRLMP